MLCLLLLKLGKQSQGKIGRFPLFFYFYWSPLSLLVWTHHQKNGTIFNMPAGFLKKVLVAKFPSVRKFFVHDSVR